MMKQYIHLFHQFRSQRVGEEYEVIKDILKIKIYHE